jgi:hypothetical protein
MASQITSAYQTDFPEEGRPSKGLAARSKTFRIVWATVMAHCQLTSTSFSKRSVQWRPKLPHKTNDMDSLNSKVNEMVLTINQQCSTINQQGTSLSKQVLKVDADRKSSLVCLKQRNNEVMGTHLDAPLWVSNSHRPCLIPTRINGEEKEKL